MNTIRPAPRIFVAIILVSLAGIVLPAAGRQLPDPDRIHRKIAVSTNNRFLQYEDGTPFFWLGDTAWLLFEKSTRTEASFYLENRKMKGFSVIQCVLVHALPEVNAYGIPAFIGNDITYPYVTPGNAPDSAGQYDYWDHVDYIIDEAAKNGIRVAVEVMPGVREVANKLVVGQLMSRQ